MSAPLSLEQLAPLLNDPTTQAALHQLLAGRQVNVGLFSSLLMLLLVLSNLDFNRPDAWCCCAASYRTVSSGYGTVTYPEFTRSISTCRQCCV
jgi:hypothetical protein